jgi:hypothetical protein
MENFHVSDLVQPSIYQVGSDLVRGLDTCYQDVLFTYYQTVSTQ